MSSNNNSDPSGAELVPSPEQPSEGTQKKTKKISKSSTGGKIMDGFFNKKSLPASKMKNFTAKARGSTSPVIGTTTAVAASLKRTTTRTMHRGTQRSKTLVRSGVSKPLSLKNKGTGLFISSANRTRVSKINSSRAFRASQTSKASTVNKFQGYSNTPKTNTAPVPSRTAAVQTTQAVNAKSLPSLTTTVSHQNLERLLDQALHRADAHKKAMQGKLPGRNWWQKVLDAPKWASLGSLALAIAILGGFFAWQNIPQVSMRLAANRANVAAAVPAYTPPGFSFSGPIEYSDKTVAIDYRANSDDSRKYVLTQQSSNETSPSLVANSLSNNKVQTSQINGTTVYIYGDQNHATWVNHGVRYTIEDNAKLDTDQILKIVDSLR